MKKSLTEHMIGRYCVVRTESAGVHAGFLSGHHKQECILSDARRIYYWDGAASLSQLARDGVNAPENCKFSVPLPSIFLAEVIEIIPCTACAERNIRAVPEWRASGSDGFGSGSGSGGGSANGSGNGAGYGSGGGYYGADGEGKGHGDGGGNE